VTYWKGGGSERVYIPIQNKMWLLDAKTSKPIPSFGNEGSIDLEKDADRDVPWLFIVSTLPGAIYQDLPIVTSRTGEGPLPWRLHLLP
jgi:quinoprotein glucose dehydrogenase